MATSRRTATNENISTYGAGGSGRDYTALTTWELATDIDLVTATQSEVLECYDDAAEFNDRSNFGGATTNSSYFRIIRPAGTIGTGGWQGNDGTPNNGVKFHNQAASNGWNISEDYFSIQDIIYQMTNPNTGNTIGISMLNTGNLLVGVIGVDITSADGTARGIRLRDGGLAVNCININCDNFGFQYDTGNCIFYNCTSVNNGGDGFNDGGAISATCKNCLADGNSQDFDAGGSYTLTNNNASGDATAPGTSPRINQTFTFVAAGSNDYHLTSSDTGAHTFGADLSADGVFAFDDDIDGDIRT